MTVRRNSDTPRFRFQVSVCVQTIQSRVDGLSIAAFRFPRRAAQFWHQYDIGMVEREKGAEIAGRVRPADAA
jgi:hypothetical protein